MTARKRIEVAAAVIENDRGEFLLAQRPPGKVYAGYWEFPGGKVEPGETAGEALKRELHEELGLDVETAYPWLTRRFDYEHAAVCLRFFRVCGWRGEPQGREQQQFVWQTAGRITVAPVLPANGPILRALELPHVYGLTCASAFGSAAFLRKLQAALAAGLRLVQVREKAMAADALVKFTGDVVALARRHGARVVLNGPASMADTAGADGVHMSSSVLMSATRRPDVAWCGASCHNAAELERACELGCDFVVLGPLAETLSHPGVIPMGWEKFAALISDYPLPVYALGGMQKDDLRTAWRQGGHGIAMMRGVWNR